MNRGLAYDLLNARRTRHNVFLTFITIFYQNRFNNEVAEGYYHKCGFISPDLK